MAASLLHKLDPDPPKEPPARTAGQIAAALALPALLLAYLLLALPCIVEFPID